MRKERALACTCISGEENCAHDQRLPCTASSIGPIEVSQTAGWWAALHTVTRIACEQGSGFSQCCRQRVARQTCRRAKGGRRDEKAGSGPALGDSRFVVAVQGCKSHSNVLKTISKIRFSVAACSHLYSQPALAIIAGIIASLRTVAAPHETARTRRRHRDSQATSRLR
jgi:hypothetical protein